MSDLKKKNRLPSHLAQSPSPARGIRGIEKPLSWFAKLVGRRPSKPIDVEVVQPNLTNSHWDAIDRKTQLSQQQQQLQQQQNPWWGPGNWLGRKTHEAELRNSAQAQMDDHAIAAQIEFEVNNPEEMRRRKLYHARRDARWAAEDRAKLLKQFQVYKSKGGPFDIDGWKRTSRLGTSANPWPNMTVPGDVGKSNSAIANFRLYGPLPLGRMHDPRDVNRMYYSRGGKSKRSKSRSNKGKKTHRFRSRSTCRRSTCRRSTCRRSTCRR